MLKIKHIEELHEIICEDSYIAKVRARDIDQLTDILKNKIGKIQVVKSTKTTMPYLNKTKCNNLIIPLTSIEEQVRIVTKINEKFNRINSINIKLEKTIESHQKLDEKIKLAKNAILDAAFSGKLVK